MQAADPPAQHVHACEAGVALTDAAHDLVLPAAGNEYLTRVNALVTRVVCGTRHVVGVLMDKAAMALTDFSRWAPFWLWVLAKRLHAFSLT